MCLHVKEWNENAEEAAERQNGSEGIVLTSHKAKWKFESWTYHNGLFNRGLEDTNELFSCITVVMWLLFLVVSPMMEQLLWLQVAPSVPPSGANSHHAELLPVL